jgi:ankyrin repeat protein
MSIWDAAAAGDQAEVQRLVGEDPSLLNAQSQYARTPLMHAAREGRWKVVRWLVDQGAALDERTTARWTALYFATDRYHTRVVRLLLEQGADPTIADDGGHTPLIRASEIGHVPTVRCLLNNPRAATTINRCAPGGRPPLWWACLKGCGGAVRALLEKGADPTIADNDGFTPMDIAKQYQNRACVKELQVSIWPLRPP